MPEDYPPNETQPSVKSPLDVMNPSAKLQPVMSKSLSELFGLLANAGAPRSAEEYKASLKGVREKLANGGVGSGVRGHTTEKERLEKTRVAGPYAKSVVTRTDSGYLEQDKNGTKTYDKSGKLISFEPKTYAQERRFAPKTTPQTRRLGGLGVSTRIGGLHNSLPANEQEKVKQNDAMMGVDGQGRTPLGKIFSKSDKIQNGGPGSGRHKAGDKVVIQDPMAHRKYQGQNGTVVRTVPARGSEAEAVVVSVPGIYESYIGHPSNVKLLNGGEGSGQKGHHTDHPPISNVQGGWEYHAPTETYSSESSQLEHSGRHDPWGRPLIMRYMKQHADNPDNEVTHWSGTIQAPPASMGTLGKAAKIKIFND